MLFNTLFTLALAATAFALPSPEERKTRRDAHAAARRSRLPQIVGNASSTVQTSNWAGAVYDTYPAVRPSCFYTCIARHAD
jgi:hypothetical protein